MCGNWGGEGDKRWDEIDKQQIIKIYGMLSLDSVIMDIKDHWNNVSEILQLDFFILKQVFWYLLIHVKEGLWGSKKSHKDTVGIKW